MLRDNLAGGQVVTRHRQRRETNAMGGGFWAELASIDGSAHLLVEIAGLLHAGRLDRDLGAMARGRARTPKSAPRWTSREVHRRPVPGSRAAADRAVDEAPGDRKHLRPGRREGFSRNAAEFARVRDLLVSVEPSVAKAKDGTVWESVSRERYDARLADVRNLVTGLSEGFDKACAPRW
ncbi:MAG: hypothetical protein ACRDTT_17860 [Pseudonocardiaceae bacterium]